MPDIIDNRDGATLLAQLQTQLPHAKRADFASGYFFLSGFAPLAKPISELDELRLLIGNVSDARTVEELAAGFERLDLARKAAQKIEFETHDSGSGARETVHKAGAQLQALDQSDEQEEFVSTLQTLIETGKLKVRVYTKERLHAKAYIFDAKNPQPNSNGVAIVGSSNFTLSGIQTNAELNVVVHDNAPTNDPMGGNHGALKAWFERLWEDAQPFDSALMEELKASWAGELNTPYEVYMKALLELLGDRLNEEDKTILISRDKIQNELADFQRDAVVGAIQKINEHGGCFVSDVVGLGKSFIGAAIVKHFERVERMRPLIICPKPLEAMWDAYNERYELNARIVPMSLLTDDGLDLKSEYEGRDFVLVDESHNFRNDGTQRYEQLEAFLRDGERKVCLLTATPLNSRVWDVYHQLRLFHRAQTTTLPVSSPDLKTFFGRVERGEARLSELTPHVMERRLRKNIIRSYGYSEQGSAPIRKMNDDEAKPFLTGEKRAYVLVGGKHNFFPKRELQTWTYSIEATYNGLYAQLRDAIASHKDGPDVGLSYARYGLFGFLKEGREKSPQYADLQRAGKSLRGLMRILLFKRFESSVYAFRKTLERLRDSQRTFVSCLERGFVPAGETAARFLNSSSSMSERELFQNLEDASKRFDIGDFRADDLKAAIEADVLLIEKILLLIAPITPDKDDKLCCFLKHVSSAPLKGKKLLIFTQYADTARYVGEALEKCGVKRLETVASSDKDKARIVARFAPIANAVVAEKFPGDAPIQVLVATDVLSEGLNLQDGDTIINYDLHWNPVRLIQRFGRIDRIGSTNTTIYGYNFLPELELEKNLGLQEKLARRIGDIHAALGEDAAILSPDEQLNEAAMRAIYEGKDAGSLFEIEEVDELAALTEAEASLRALRREDPNEWKRLNRLRDGIRSGKRAPGSLGRRVVMCRAGAFRSLMLLSPSGEVESRDATKILAMMKSARDEESLPLLPGHNEIVMRAREEFWRDARMRRQQQRKAGRISPAQDYVRRELDIAFNRSEDGDLQNQILSLKKVFEREGLPSLVKRELNVLKKSGVVGAALVDGLVQIYVAHGLSSKVEVKTDDDAHFFPQIVCSLSLS